MPDFGAALALGFEANTKAQQAHHEIQAVLDELERQINDVTGGLVKLEHVNQPREVAAHGPRPVGVLGFVPPLEDHRVLRARSRGLPPRVLCDFEPSRAGYPVTVAFGDEQRECFDRQSLEQALLDMLQDPIVAGDIRALMEAGPRSPASSSQPMAEPTSSEDSDK
jgi:hypothetical protein